MPGRMASAGGASIGVRGGYQQQPGVVLDPLQLLRGQRGEQVPRRCSALQRQIGLRVLETANQHTCGACPMSQADQLNEVVSVGLPLQSCSHRGVHGLCGIEAAQSLHGIAGQIKDHATVLANTVSQANEQPVSHTLAQHLQQAGVAMQASVGMGTSTLYHLAQGLLHLFVDVALERRNLRSQCQA
ncbi:hypothetical protein D3C76_977260 [compost metagenome]